MFHGETYVHCLSWAEFSALWLYPVTPRSAKQAANMTEPPTRGFAQSLVLIRAFALLTEQITGQERFSFTSEELALPPPFLLSQENMHNAAMRVEALVMAILRTLSETMKARERSLTIMLLRPLTG